MHSILPFPSRAPLLQGEEWDVEEATALVEAGWMEDTRGTGVLSRSMFNDSLFEFVDVWAETSKPE